MLPCCTRFNSPLSPSCVRSSNSMVKERMTSTLLYAADSNLKVEGLAMGSCRFDNRGNLNKLIHQVKNTYITCGCWSWFDGFRYCLTDVWPCRSFLGRLPHPDVLYAHVQCWPCVYCSCCTHFHDIYLHCWPCSYIISFGKPCFLEKRRGHQKKQAKDSSQHLRHMSFRHGIDGEGGMYNPHLMFPKEDVQSPPKQPPKQPPKLADVFNRHFLYERPNDIYQIESAQKVRERCSQHDQSRSSSGYHFDGEEE